MGNETIKTIRFFLRMELLNEEFRIGIHSLEAHKSTKGKFPTPIMTFWKNAHPFKQDLTQRFNLNIITQAEGEMNNKTFQGIITDDKNADSFLSLSLINHLRSQGNLYPFLEYEFHTQGEKRYQIGFILS